ncbi:hypothetical protein GCM10025782_35140 [Pedococcus ginsenosidimutans]|uniref:Uncharacterized protein n=1 Tax=Pedococcus ginsenosidimutans TaxID=490570 RepID=A0ABP8YME1_9MICO
MAVSTEAEGLALRARTFGAAVVVLDVVVEAVVGPVVEAVVGGAVVLEGLVVEPLAVGPDVVDVPVVVPVDDVPDVVLVLGGVVVTGVVVGSVVAANAVPGTTRLAARARANAAAGRALTVVRCMVPLQCERCRDGCTGTWRKTRPPRRSRDNGGRPRTWCPGSAPRTSTEMEPLRAPGIPARHPRGWPTVAGQRRTWTGFP